MVTARAGKSISQREIRDVFLLLGVPLFTGMTAEDLVPVAEVAGEVQFREGDVIYREGEPGEFLYVVIDGEVVLTRGGAEVGRVGRRGWLGELAVLDRGAQVETASARTLTTLLAIDTDAFEQLLLVHPALAQAVIGVLARRLREVNAAGDEAGRES